MVDTPEFWELSQKEDIAAAVINFMGWRENRRDRAYELDRTEKDWRKNRYDRGVRIQRLKVGDLVMKMVKAKVDGKLMKLVNLWDGPYWIIKEAGEYGISFVIRKLGKKKDECRTYHGDHLYLFHPRQGYLIPEVESVLPHYKEIRSWHDGKITTHTHSVQTQPARPVDTMPISNRAREAALQKAKERVKDRRERESRLMKEDDMEEDPTILQREDTQAKSNDEDSAMLSKQPQAFPGGPTVQRGKRKRLTGLEKVIMEEIAGTQQENETEPEEEDEIDGQWGWNEDGSWREEKPAQTSRETASHGKVRKKLEESTAKTPREDTSDLGETDVHLSGRVSQPSDQDSDSS